MEVELVEISPGPDFDVEKEADKLGLDLFSAVIGFFWGDVRVVSDEFTILFENIKFVQFSTTLVSSAFLVAFRGEPQRVLTIPTKRSRMRMTINNLGSEVEINLVMGVGGRVEYNGTGYGPGEMINFSLAQHVFTRLSGALHGRTIEFLDQRLDGIDGVEEFFGRIPFSEGYDNFL